MVETLFSPVGTQRPTRIFVYHSHIAGTPTEQLFLITSLLTIQISSARTLTHIR